MVALNAKAFAKTDAQRHLMALNAKAFARSDT